MKTKRTSSLPATKNKFVSVFIGDLKIPRLQQRNNRFYLRKKDPNFPDKPAARIPLDSTNAAEAKDEAETLNLLIKRKKVSVSELLKQTDEPKEPKTKTKEGGDTFEAVASGYLNDCKAKKIRPNTLRCYVGDLKVWEDEFGGCHLGEITQKEISSVVREWRRESEDEEIQISNYRIRKRLHTLYRMFGWAVDEQIFDGIPFEMRFVKKLVGKIEAKGQRRLLKEDELNRLIASAKATNGRSLGGKLADIIELMASSGLRKGEAFPLRWRQVNFDQQILVVEKGKTSTAARSINFNPILKGVLTRLHKEAKVRSEVGKDEFIFKTNYRMKSWQDNHPDATSEQHPSITNLQRLLYRVAEKAGLSDFAKDPNRDGLHSQENLGFHDFRRFFITRCLHGGVPLPTIARWVGHRDGGVLILKTYVQNDEDLARKYASELTLWKQTKKP